MIELSEEQEAEVVEKITAGIEAMHEALLPQHEKYEEWRKAAEGRPRYEAKTYPHAKSTNLAIPLTMDQHQTMYGALISALLQRKPLAMAEAVQKDSPHLTELADVVTEYLDLLSMDDAELGLHRFARPWLNSSCLLGVGFYEVIWDRREHQVAATRTAADGSVENIKYTVIDHDGPAVIFTQPEDRLWDQAFQDLNISPVVADRFVLSEEQLRERGASGEYVGVEKVLENLTRVETENESDMRQRLESDRGDTPVAELHRGYVYFDIDQDDFFEDLLFVVHVPSKTLLYLEFNPYGERMCGAVSYKLRPGWVQGMGVGWSTEHPQEAMNSLWNIRFDGLKLRSIPVWLARRGSGVAEHEDIWAGKRIFVDDPARDLVAMTNQWGFGETRAEEQNLLFWSQRANGASDSLAGFPDGVMKSSDTVGGQVLRLKQSSAMFQTILSNYEEALGDIFRKVFKVLVLHKEEVLAKEASIGRMSPEKQALLAEALDMDLQDIPLKLRFSINTTDVDETFEMQRQNVMTVTNIVKLWTEGMLGLGQLIDAPPGVVGPAQKAIAAGSMELVTKLMGETLKLFSHEESLGSLPDIKKLEFLRRLQEGLFGMNLMQQAQSIAQAAGGGMNAGVQAAPALAQGAGVGAQPGAGGPGPGPGQGLPGSPGLAGLGAGPGVAGG